MRAGKWQDSGMDLQLAKTRYNIAFDAYHEIARQNARSALGGGHPSVDDLEREQAALEALEAARRAYIEALSSKPPVSLGRDARRHAL